MESKACFGLIGEAAVGGRIAHPWAHCDTPLPAMAWCRHRWWIAFCSLFFAFCFLLSLNVL